LLVGRLGRVFVEVSRVRKQDWIFTHDQEVGHRREDSLDLVGTTFLLLVSCFKDFAVIKGRDEVEAERERE
jgi:hypothetical protein